MLGTTHALRLRFRGWSHFSVASAFKATPRTLPILRPIRSIIHRPVKSLVTRHSLREMGLVSAAKKVFSKTRILVAEDNPTNQKVALGQLGNLGFQAQAVSNGRQVLEAIEKDDYDIILMDCEMPEMDGFEATAEIRRREGVFRRTTIIAMTANAIDGDNERCLASGMDDYLSKPVKSDMLKQKLLQWIEPTGEVASSRRISSNRKSVNPSAAGVINMTVLSGLKELQQPGEPDFLTELIDLFLNDSASQLEALRRAVSANDAPEVRRVAHLMKGSSASIGADGLAAINHELETKGLDMCTNERDGHKLLVVLEAELQQVGEALNRQRRI